MGGPSRAITRRSPFSGSRLERSPRELHIPATVHGVLAARIDRQQAEEKDLLQTLAVIGNEFPLELVRKVTGDKMIGLKFL